MSTQEWLVAATVAGAVGYLVWRYARSWRRRGCDTGCGGCGSKAAAPAGLVSLDELTARVKGRGSQR
ncbi:MAG: FeoB-associated Cys-rich membrane protein [Gemmataceae bacterium]